MRIPYFSLKRVVSVLLLRFQSMDIIPGSLRGYVLKLAGVKILGHTHIGGVIYSTQ